MGKGSSSSSTTSTSETINADQRVAAEGSAIAIGAGAAYTPIYNFPKEVADFANRVLDFSAGVLEKANEAVQKVIASNENTVYGALAAGEKATSEANVTSAAALTTAQTGTSLNLNNILPFAIIGVVVIVAINLFKRRG